MPNDDPQQPMQALPDNWFDLSPGQQQLQRKQGQKRPLKQGPLDELPTDWYEWTPGKREQYRKDQQETIPRVGGELAIQSLPLIGAGAAMLFAPEGAPLWLNLAARGALGAEGMMAGTEGEILAARKTGLDYGEPQTWPEAKQEIGRAGRVGAESEVGVGAFGWGLRQVARLPPVANVLSKMLPEELYKRSIKIPPSMGSQFQTKVAKTGVAERIPLTPAGSEKTGLKIAELSQQVRQTIANAPKDIRGPQYVKTIEDRLQPLRDRARLDASKGDEMLKVIDEQERQFYIQHGNVKPLKQFIGYDKQGQPIYKILQPKDMTLQRLRTRANPISTVKAQEIKSATYENIRTERKAMGGLIRIAGYSPGTHAPLELATRQELVRALREEIGNRYPGIHQLNERDGALMDLDDAIDRFLTREGNKELLPYLGGLATAAEVGKGDPIRAVIMGGATILLKTLKDPAVNSYLAFALDAASRQPLGGSTLARGVGAVARRGAKALPGAAVRYPEEVGHRIQKRAEQSDQPIATIEPVELPGEPGAEPAATPPAAANQPQANLQEQTAKEYPAIADQLRKAAFRVSPQQPGDSRGLEFYPPGESDSFDPKRPAIEVFDPQAQPKDVAGDLVSHYLAKGIDPTVTKAYRDFEASLTPQQKSRLQDQYQYAKQNFGETRPFNEWYQMSGLPAYFRGYLFKQWPDPDKFYTKQQIQQFDALNQYLKKPAAKPTGQAALPAEIDRMLTQKAAGRVPAALVRAVASVESSDDPTAVGKETKSGQALGLMQLMPSVIQQYNVREPFDPEESADAGISLLQNLMGQYRGNIPDVLAAYYWGPGNLDAYRKHYPNQPLPQSIQTYVDKALDKMGYKSSAAAAGQ